MRLVFSAQRLKKTLARFLPIRGDRSAYPSSNAGMMWRAVMLSICLLRTSVAIDGNSAGAHCGDGYGVGTIQGDQARGILVVDACGAGQNLHNEQNFSMG